MTDGINTSLIVDYTDEEKEAIMVAVKVLRDAGFIAGVSEMFCSEARIAIMISKVIITVGDSTS